MGIEKEELLVNILKFLGIGEYDNELFILSESHINAINNAKEEIRKGEYKPDDQINKEIDEWLKK